MCVRKISPMHTWGQVGPSGRSTQSGPVTAPDPRAMSAEPRRHLTLHRLCLGPRRSDAVTSLRVARRAKSWLSGCVDIGLRRGRPARGLSGRPRWSERNCVGPPTAFCVGWPRWNGRRGNNHERPRDAALSAACGQIVASNGVGSPTPARPCTVPKACRNKRSLAIKLAHHARDNVWMQPRGRRWRRPVARSPCIGHPQWPSGGSERAGALHLRRKLGSCVTLEAQRRLPDLSAAVDPLDTARRGSLGGRGMQTVRPTLAPGAMWPRPVGGGVETGEVPR